MTSPTWRLRMQHFLMPKQGSTPAECEDVVAFNGAAHRYAVADGATEAFDARSWAVRLAEDWVRAEPAPVSLENFRPWVAEQGRRLHEAWEGRQLSWYAEEKARSGSFAAFVGVEFRGDENRLDWSVIALGDSCLIHLRGGSLCRALPVSDPRDFNSTPVLVPSQEALQEAALSKAVTDSGAAHAGDIFLLLSDAAAAWYLKLREGHEQLLAEFDSLLAASQNEGVGELLQEERRAGRMKDDDVAILRIGVERT